MSILDLTSTKLLEESSSTVNSTGENALLPSKYDRKNIFTLNKYCKLCLPLIFVVFVISVTGTIRRIISCSSVKPSEYNAELPTTYTTKSFINISSQTSRTITSLQTTTSITTKPSTDLQQPIRKVLFIIADGIPADVIEKVSINHMKHIQQIGAYTRAYVGGQKGTYSQTATISSPGYMSLLTGTWANKHNVYNNYVKNPNYHYKNIFRLVKKEKPEKQIAIFSTWTTNRLKLIGEGLAKAGNITFDYKFDGYELDRITYPHDKKSLYIYNIDQRVTNETSKCIRTYAPNLSWVYLQYTDDIGHYFGDSEQFNQSIISLDNQIGQIWNSIEYRMNYHREDWLLMITTDHGRDAKKGKHHADQSIRERTTWIITNSQQMNNYFHDFQPGIVDILPTIIRYMDISIPIESQRELDGIPLIGKVSLIQHSVYLIDDQLNISWTALDNTGNVIIWISTTNLFKKGINDEYQLLGIVPIDRKMFTVDIQGYPSKFYKVVLEGQYNTVNQWIYRENLSTSKDFKF